MRNSERSLMQGNQLADAMPSFESLIQQTARLKKNLHRNRKLLLSKLHGNYGIQLC